MNKSTPYDAIMTLEENEDATLLDQACAMQSLINSGQCWQLQGSYGRMAMSMIEDGLCLLGTSDHRDYWGNHVPSRDQVQDGTKGSYGYVVDHTSKEHADAVAAV